jgi:outer membrane protein assembly factor BamA
VTISGQAAIDKGGLRDANFAIKGQQMALEYLEAKFLADADLTMTGRSGDLILGGTVVASRGLYQKSIFLEDPLRAPELKTSSSPFLQTIGLRLDVRAREFVVNNNIANLRIRGSFRISGTADEPTPFGRVTVLQNGSVLIQQKKFFIKDPDGATLRYEGTFSPELYIVAESEKLTWTKREGGTEKDGIIEVIITGNLDNPRLSFRSPTHTLTETEMASIIATGTQDATSLEGETLVVGQLGSLLASHLQERLSRGLLGLNLGGVGLDEVAIEPHLISGTAEPSARITFGKHLTSWSSIAYSFSTENTEEPFFRLSVRPLSNVSASIERDNSDTYRGSLTHHFELGAPTPRPRAGADAAQKAAIQEIRFEGAFPETPAMLQQWAGVSPGQERTQWDLQDNAARIKRQLVERGHIEAQADARLESNVAVFTVRAGPRYTWRVSGMENAPDLTSIVRSALYAEEALSTGAQRLLKELRGRGHHKAVVGTETQGEGGERVLVFAATPGPAYAAADIVFEGASVLSEKTLLRAAGGIGEFVTEPGRARRRVEERYHEEYFLQAKVGRPQVDESGPRLTVKVPVEEGRQAQVARVRFSGSSLHEDELQAFVAGVVGTPPDELGIPTALKSLRARYFDLGYPEARVSSRLVPVNGDLEMHVAIYEGPQVHIREIAIEGRSRVSQGIVRSALPFKEGDPLDPRKFGRAEVKLAEYKVRARVGSDPKDAARVVVTMRRSPKLTVDYGIKVATSSRPGFTADVRAPNLLPRGITPSVAVFELPHDRLVRGALTSPALLHRGLLDVWFELEDQRRNPDGSVPGTGNTDAPAEDQLRTLTRHGRLSQRLEIGNRWRLEYGYDLSHVTTTSSFFLLPIEADIGKVRVSLLRDTRDSLLDARNGRLWTITLSYAPRALGTDFEFVKAFGQVSVYRALAPQLTWAQAYRVGLGRGIGGPFFFKERFTTGGTSSLRGYANEAVGPLDPITGNPGPGDALVVLNQELRYHHATGLGAVLFYDVGNVYDKTADVDLNLRHSIGAGLRYASPVGLLRVDLGVPLNRRRDLDDGYQIFFSLGQAF